MSDYHDRFFSYAENIRKRTEAMLPTESRKRTLEVKNVRLVDTSTDRIHRWDEFQKAKEIGGSFLGRVVADVRLIDKKDGKVVDEKKGHTLTYFPHMNALGSYIVNGKELQVINQLRRLPGAYPTIMADNNVETKITAAGLNHNTVFDRASGDLLLKVRSSHLKLVPLLEEMGVSRSDMEQALGKDLVEHNMSKARKGSELSRFFKLTRRIAEPSDHGELKKVTNEWLASKKVTIAKDTIGADHAHVSPDLYLDSAKAAVEVARGNRKPADMESLVYKSVHSIEDFVDEAMERSTQSMLNRTAYLMDRKSKLTAILSPAQLSKPIINKFVTSEFTRFSNQNNPLDILGTMHTVTMLGEGGIQSSHAITDTLRNVHNSHAGFLDVVHTPENCYHPDMEVMTRQGWVRWDQATVEHEYACLSDDDALFWSKPEAIHEHDFDGTLVGFRSATVEFAVTPGHRLWCRDHRGPGESQYRFELANDAKSKGRLVRCGGHKAWLGDTELEVVEITGERTSNAMKDRFEFAIEDWAELLGWFLSEGHARRVENKVSYVSISQHEGPNPAKVARIAALLDRMKLKYSYNGKEFKTHSSMLVSYLKQFGGAGDKYIPEEVFDWPLEARERFVEAMLLGDGRKGKGEHYAYCTVSRRLADDMQRMLFSLGRSSRIVFEADARPQSNFGGCWVVHIHLGDERIVKPKLRAATSGYYDLPYKGKVHCVTVPGGRLYVRHNGKGGHWSGNSSIGVVTHLAHGVKKKGNQLYQRVFDTHTNKMVDATPIDIARGGLGFPDYYKNQKGKLVPRKATVIGISNGDIKTVKAKELRYVIPNSSTLFSAVTNGIPFLNANSANRMLMADRHIEQAVPLTDPESPLVQADMHGQPYDKTMGNLVGYVAQKPGRISGVKKDKIVVKYDGDSKSTEVYFPTEYPLNGESYLTLSPEVKTGQRIKPGQQLFATNFTNKGSLALGKNLTTAVMPWRGLSYEDGIVISEAAARKLTSTHKIELEVDKTGGVEVSHDKLFAHFPDQRERHVAGRDKALPQVGQILKTGDLVIPAISPVRIDADTDYGRVHKALRSPFRNSSVYWDNDVDGVVKKIINTHGMTRVYVETKEPLVVGDKISTRAGSKGIVTAVIPDNQMPRIKATGDPVDVLFNPYGIPGRVNPTFLMENARSKIADKTGKTEVVKSFDTQVTPSIVGETLADLKKHGLSDTETLFDPTHQTDHDSVMVGKNYWLKLKHQVRNKMSGRSHEGAYTKDERPSRGGGESAQSIGALEIYSLMSGGMTDFLRDATGIKGTKNSEYWNAFQLGLPTPQPKTPLIMEKFEHYLRGAGINVARHGNKLKATPFTDKDILARSSGAVVSPNVLRTGKHGLHPERGGLFDPAITGGFDATKSNHIELAERMLNPLYEHPAASVLGLSTKELNGYLSGETEFDGKYGGEALAAMLDKIDVKAELKETASSVKSAPKTKRDKLLRRLKYLSSLDKLGVSPKDAYTNKLVHVIPTKFRPIYDLPDGSLNVADANHGYREVLFISKELERLKNMGADDSNLAPLRKGLYEAYSGLTGLTEPLTRSGSFRGFISNIAGAQNKHGLFQSKVVARRQDLSGRSTIINSPHLGMDEVGIPYEMARQIYKPYLVRELVTGSGLKPVDAREEVEKGSERVDKLTEVVMRSRPVLLNRAPSLHKFSTIPLLPHPVRGKAIQLNPLVFGGLNADIDGDTVAVHVPHSEAAREELLRNLPSKQLFSPKSGGVQHTVGAEATLGLYMASKPNKLLDPVDVSSPEAALKMLRENKIKMNQPLKYQKQTWTAGHFLMNQILPQPYHFESPDVLNGARWGKMTNDIAKTHPEEAGSVISKMKDLGFDASSRLGFSIDLKSLVVAEVQRDAIAKEVMKRAKTDPVKAIEWGTKQMERILDDLPDEHPYKMMTFGSGAKNKHRVNVRQLMLAPVGVTNNKGQIVPVPILRSYADGLDTAQYWATLPGARKGIADRAVSTQETGAFAKELLNTTINTRVTTADCGTKQGIQMAADHPDFGGRYMASGPYAGKLITSDMVGALQKKSGMHSVRSPMTCELTDGVCQKCSGLNESGQHFPVGFHLGAYAGTTISEPITQMVMRAFHTQGAIGGKEIGFKRVRQIFSMPENIKGKATMATTEGTVEDIAEAAGGGWNVLVDGEKHFVLQETGLGVTLGEKIVKGHKLSATGALKLQEVAELRGHEAARDQLLADLDEEMGSAGQNIRRRIYEMAVKPMIDKVEVIDPGDAAAQGMVEGDVVNANYIKQLNTKLKHPVDYRPIIMSIKQVPFSGEDFIGPLQYQRLPRTLREAPAVGATSILKGTGSHPIVEYATGNI